MSIPFFRFIQFFLPAHAAADIELGETGTPDSSSVATHESAAIPTQRLIEALQDPAIIIDARQVILNINSAAQILWPNLKPDINLALHLRKPELLEAITYALTNGKSVHIEFAEKIPQERNFTCYIAYVSANIVLITIRDLTQSNKIEQMRVDFVTNASHELKTPIASILGFIETLQGSAKNDAVAREKFLVIMRTQAQRMARLVEDLLSLSRFELLEHIPPSESVDLSALCRDVIVELSGVAQENAVELRLDLPDHAITVGVRDDLFRVFENIIENAIKYGQSGKYIDISILDTHDHYVFSVKDYGLGISEEHLPRLTERFYRVDDARSREKGGTGLGLAIVKHIISRHKGKIKFHSEYGKGLTVSVEFVKS